MRLNTLIGRVERVQRDMLLIVRGACEREERAIVELNRLQLQRGLNAEGELMNGGEYSDKYAAFRRRKGLPTDHVYLLLSGDLREGMEVVFGDTGFSLVSRDWKQQLVDEVMRTGFWPSSGYNAPEYGPVFGLDEESRRVLVGKIGGRVSGGIRNRLLQGW